MEVKCKMVVRLGERIEELVELELRFGDFGQYRWVVPPFGMVSTNNWWLVGVVDFLLEVA